MVDLNLSARAADHIRKALGSRKKGLGIRFGVRTTGCSGLAYTMEFVDVVDPDDLIVPWKDFSVFISPKHAVYLEGLEVDYIKQGLNEGFEFLNPNEAARCGCGESFSV